MAKAPGKSKFFRNRKVKTPIADALVRGFYKQKYLETQHENANLKKEMEIQQKEHELTQREKKLNDSKLNLAEAREKKRRERAKKK